MKILEHELKAIDSLHNKRGILHIVQGMSASFAAGCVLAMVGIYFVEHRWSVTLSAGAIAGAFLAAGGWFWKCRLQFRLESLTHRIRLRETGPPAPDAPDPGRRVKIG